MNASCPHEQLTDPELAASRAEILKALGNPVRLRAVALLCHRGELRVTDIVEALGVPQSTMSRQLSLLKLHGLVRARQEGTTQIYEIALPQVTDLMRCLSSCERP